LTTEKDIALIDAFIAGKLVGNDKTDFEMRVKRDLEFAKTVRQQIHAVEHLEIYGAASMGSALRGDMQTWKAEGGHKPYKSEYMAKQMLIKVISTVVILASAAGAVWYFVLREEPVKVKPVIEEPIEEAIPEPQPEVSYDTSMSLIELKSSEDQIADIKLDIQDPTTFSIVEIAEENGVYTYLLEYDGESQTIKSSDPDLDDTLMQMADDAIAGGQDEAKTIVTPLVKTTNRQATKPAEPAEKTVEPVVKKAPPPVKPRPKRNPSKVEDDFPY
jgi:hypothetical protein